MINVRREFSSFTSRYWKDLLGHYCLLFEYEVLELLRETISKHPEEWLEEHAWKLAKIVINCVSSSSDILQDQTTDLNSTFWIMIKQLTEHNLISVDDLKYRFELFSDVFTKNESLLCSFELRAKERQFREGKNLTFENVQHYCWQVTWYGRERLSTYLNESLITYFQSNKESMKDPFIHLFLSKTKAGQRLQTLLSD
jgi:hypothetical protein